MHFHYTDQKHRRKFYYEQLGKIWNCNYEKEGKKYSFCQNIYFLLEEGKKASQEKAIKRAKKLHEDQKELTFHEQNPITLVYELVRFLKKNCRR